MGKHSEIPHLVFDIPEAHFIAEKLYRNPSTSGPLRANGSILPGMKRFIVKHPVVLHSTEAARLWLALLFAVWAEYRWGFEGSRPDFHC